MSQVRALPVRLINPSREAVGLAYDRKMAKKNPGQLQMLWGFLLFTIRRRIIVFAVQVNNRRMLY